MVGLRAGLAVLSLGRQTVARRPRLLLLAWLLQVIFAALAAAPAWSVFINSLEHRPVFSNELLNDFSMDLLVRWRAAYGQPMPGLLLLAAILIVLYAAAKIALDCFIFPAYLAPFDDFGDGRLGRAAACAAPGVIGASLAGLGLSLVLAGFVLAVRDKPWTVVAVIVLGAFWRVLTNLWKCGNFGEARAAIWARPGCTFWLTLVTLGSVLLYGSLAGAWVWFDLLSANPLAMFLAAQVLVFAGVYLRLWLAASAVVLWRAQSLSALDRT
jgi:hypothetical protein